MTAVVAVAVDPSVQETPTSASSNNNPPMDTNQTTLTNASPAAVDAAVEKNADVECLSCHSVGYKDFDGIVWPLGFDFKMSYPFETHGFPFEEKWGGSNFISDITWDVSSSGLFHDTKYTGILSRDKNDSRAIAMSTISDKPVHDSCTNMLCKPDLKQFLAHVAIGEYSDSPDPLCPVSCLRNRLENLRVQRQNNRLEQFNMERKINTLFRKANDHARILQVIEREDTPNLSALLTVHLRNGGGIQSFINKCMTAAETKMVGDNTHRRGHVQQGRKQKDGTIDPERMKILKMTLLMIKLGCNRLSSTCGYAHGGMSHRQARRHLADGTIPNPKCIITNCLDDQGAKAIEKNIDDAASSSTFDDMTNGSGKRLMHLLVHRVAVEECIDVDTS